MIPEEWREIYGALYDEASKSEDDLVKESLKCTLPKKLS